MTEVFRDLLGDPVPANHGGRGRPAHVPTDENRNKVRLLLAFGRPPRYIAQALRITGPTLRKHYFAELRQRDEARPALEAALLSRLWEAVTGGNVGAMKELGRRLERLDLAPAAAKPEKLGKKAQAHVDAQTAHEGNPWSDLVH